MADAARTLLSEIESYCRDRGIAVVLTYSAAQVDAKNADSRIRDPDLDNARLER